MLRLPCDIFIPAAVPDVIDEKVARELGCRYVVEAANGPTTVEGKRVLIFAACCCQSSALAEGGRMLHLP